MGEIWMGNVETWRNTRKYGINVGECGKMEKYEGNMGEIWEKYGRNMGEMWKYEGMWKYEENMGAILVDNIYTNQCV